MKKEIFHFEELFRDVQLSGVFEDGKTFPDCTPNKSLEDINATYLRKRNDSGFNLKEFVHANFILPEVYSSSYKSDTSKPVLHHIHALWDELTRKPSWQEGTLIPLPYPYIVPGGRFREIYYWDSYFTMLGLQVSGKTDMIENMVNNFAHLIDTVGYIPNGNRSYFIGRSQPPFFSCMVRLLDRVDKSALTDHLPHLEKEYKFWMRGAESLSKNTPVKHRVVLLTDGTIVNRYWDENDTPRPESFKEDVELSHRSKQKPAELFRNIRAAAESGWDFSTRWFREGSSFESIHTTEIIPVDLNCLLFHLEQTLSEAWQRLGNQSKAKDYVSFSERRKEAINKYCWNASRGFYFDYDFVAQKQKQHETLAAAFPLFFNMALPSQATFVGNNLQSKFLKQGGLITTLINSGQQWDEPNGWAPLQWIAYKGLKNYEQDDLANELKRRWLKLAETVYSETGKMMEKYNVLETSTGGGGEYPNQDGFGWTNGVTAAMLSDQ